MKSLLFKINIIVFCIICGINYAQIGINTETPNKSSILEIKSKGDYKGVMFPKVFLNSSTDQSTIQNPKESLIVYNTNKSLFGKQSLVYWSGEKWVDLMPGTKAMADKYPQENIYNIYAYNFSARKPRTYSPPFYNKYPFEIGDNINSEWTVIEDFTNNIVFKRQGNLLLSFWGGIQGNKSSFMEGSIGVFIDDKLRNIKTFSTNLIPPAFTHQLFFNFWVDNISKGTHNIKVAIRNSYRASSSLTVTYGGQNNSDFEKTGTWNPIAENDNFLGMSLLLMY